MTSPSPYKRSIMILADGARADLFQKLIQKGELPEIAQHLPSFRTGTTAFPSTTGPAYMPYLTGCYPGTCNVPGIRWFDKEAYSSRSYVGAETFFITRDMDRRIKTLFDLIPNSINIFNSVSRGVPLSHNRTWFSRIWYWYYAHLTDHWSLIDRAAEEKVLQEINRPFEFLFVVFPGIDEHSHLSNPFHPQTIEAYKILDRAVGNMVKKLKSKNLWEETALFIVSDHGLSETQTHLELNEFLSNLKMPPFYYPKVVFRYGFLAASMVSGNGMAHLYLKGEKGWKGRMPWEEIMRKDQLVDRLLAEPAVDLIAGQALDGSIVVKSRRGEARIGRDLDYTIKGADPFGYPPLPSAITDRESLHLTFNTDYPDALMQLVQIFRSQRAGDLVLSASKGFDLRRDHEVPEHHSSHGSLHWEHMQVPIVTNVPLPEAPIRSVDLFPTVLTLLGKPVPASIDGQSLLT